MWDHTFRSPVKGPQDADRRNQAGAVPRAGLVLESRLSRGWVGQGSLATCWTSV